MKKDSASDAKAKPATKQTHQSKAAGSHAKKKAHKNKK
jgi:hypothetical protein